MSLSHGPAVVTNGLVLALDAADRNSYPGSGTTWTDLSGRGNNGTLTNGPTYSSSNGGSIVFDGTNDYATKSDAIMIGGQNVKVTVEVAFFLPTGGGGWIITNERQSNTQGHGWYWCDNTSLKFTQHSYAFPPYTYEATASSTGFSNIKINGWNIVSWAVDVGVSTMSCNFMINGYTETINVSSLLWSASTTTEDNIDIARWRNFTYGTPYTNCRVSNVKIYNKILSQSEQLQNFNALRGRFGL
jgi:hypothetical protein